MGHRAKQGPKTMVKMADAACGGEKPLELTAMRDIFMHIEFKFN